VARWGSRRADFFLGSAESANAESRGPFLGGGTDDCFEWLISISNARIESSGLGLSPALRARSRKSRALRSTILAEWFRYHHNTANSCAKVSLSDANGNISRENLTIRRVSWRYLWIFAEHLADRSPQKAKILSAEIASVAKLDLGNGARAATAANQPVVSVLQDCNAQRVLPIWRRQAVDPD
jgi:hypothetical protein